MQRTKESEPEDSSPSTLPFRTGPGLKVNIGCGRAPKEGFVNCDLFAGPGVDQVFDCQKRWPFLPQSVARIECDHTLEHLPDPLAFFRESWRVLMLNGSMLLRLPYGWHRSAWWDLTHLRPWLQESFAIVQPGFTTFTRNYQHEAMGFAFWVAQVTLVLEKKFARLWHHGRWVPGLRSFVLFCGDHLLNVYRDLIVELYKTTEEDERSAAYGGEHHPAVVPCSIGALEHELYGRSPKAGLQYHTIIIFTIGGNRSRQAAGF